MRRFDQYFNKNPLTGMNKNTFSWIAQIIVVVIIGQTVWGKLTDTAPVVELFGSLGMQSGGYKLIALLELVAIILLLIRPSIIWGAILGWGLMTGALIAHTTEIGFGGDNGVLGALAFFAWLLCSLIIFLRRDQASIIKNMFGRQSEDRSA